LVYPFQLALLPDEALLYCATEELKEIEDVTSPMSFGPALYCHCRC